MKSNCCNAEMTLKGEGMTQFWSCDVCVHAIIEALYPRLNSVVSLRNPTLLSNS